MQLRQAKPLSAFDEHDRRVGHVDAHLDHGRRDQHVELAIAKRAHDCVLVGRPHAAVQQSQLQRSELAGSQPLVFFGRRFGLERLRLLHQRADDEGLLPARRGTSDALVGVVALVGSKEFGDGELAARRHLVDGRQVQVAEQAEVQRARNRRGGHDQQMWHGYAITRAPTERDPLANAEAVLLVDNDQAEPGELESVLNERLRADDDVQVTAGRGSVGLRALLAFDAARQQTDDGLTPEHHLQPRPGGLE